MIPRERIWTALEKGEPDRVPMFEFDVQIGDKIIGPKPAGPKDRGREADLRRINFEYKAGLWKRLGYDMISVPRDLLPLARSILPDLAYLGGCGAVSPMPGSMADIDVIRRFYYDQRSVRKECRALTLKAIEVAKAEMDAGLMIIRGGLDDMAGREGPYLAPRFYEKFIFPNLARLARAIHRGGGKLLVHSDGDLRPILDGLVGSGIDALHSIDPSSGMDIGQVKDRYGDRICIFGNVDCAWTLTREGVPEVVGETKSCIERAAPGGGYVLSSSNVIHASVPLENALAMVEAGRRFGRYE